MALATISAMDKKGSVCFGMESSMDQFIKG